MTSNLQQTIQLQQLASNPNNSAWVFASAGSGKTKILIDRLLRLLLADVRPDKILCLTFTKIATSEMQNRINKELANWVLLGDEELFKKLSDLNNAAPSSQTIKKARTLFTKILDDEHKIKIQTIHSFCQNMVTIFPFEAGIKPNFEVMEESQERLLLQKAQKNILQQAPQNQELKNLVVKINSILNEETFLEIVLDLLKKKDQLIILKEKFFNIDGIIAEIFKIFSVSQNSTEEKIFAEFIAKNNFDELSNAAESLENSGSKTDAKIALGIRDFIKNPLLENFSSYQETLFTDKGTCRKFSKKIADNHQLSNYLANQQKLVEDFSDQLNSLKICNSSALLLKFVDHILENYLHLKAQNSFLDYNDLIIETNRLLQNPNFAEWVKMKMDGLFDHILIDESQDTNHQQWNIIKSLTEDFFAGLGASNKTRTIFVVGDEKQSIYSFQGSDPNISEEIFTFFAKKLKDHPVKFHKIDLNNSFRSLENVLKAVDKTFSGEKEKSAITKISEFKEHKAIRSGLGRFEIWPQIKKKKLQKDDSCDWKINFDQKENSADFLLAEIIAIKIKNWVENKRILENSSKPLEYGDFMILIRKRTNGFDKILTKFFHKYKIPVSSQGRIKFSENLIIQDLLAAARFALLQDDDLNLAALLKSPLCLISEDQLLEICNYKNSNNISIYNALGLMGKFRDLKYFLDDLIEKSQQLNSFEFFYYLLEEKNLSKNIIARFGDQSLEILNKFTLKTADFCDKLSPNLQRFLDFVEKLDPEISLSSHENNSVFITTIHSAKGLQSKVVIIPDTCFNFNQSRSAKEKISWMNFADEKFPIWCSKKSDENKLLIEHREEQKRLAKEESLRLLYVAMTRAEDELYIAGFGNDDNEESWYRVIKNVAVDGFRKESFWADQKIKNLLTEDFEVDGEALVMGSEYCYDIVKDGLPRYARNDDTSAEFESEELSLRAQRANPPSTKATKSSPSQIDQSQIKGRLIHKILEIIGKNHQENKEYLSGLSGQIIASESFLNISEKNQIVEKIDNFINSKIFDELFLHQVKCEVPIIGEIENRSINARIDLLVIKKSSDLFSENELLIVDYKSDETIPSKAPKPYVDQLNLYKKLIEKIYPKQKISTAILWLSELKLEIL